MPRIELDIETSLDPDKVIAMITDFSEHRPDTWPGLSGEVYEACSVGGKTAEIREGAKTEYVEPGALRLVDTRPCALGGRREQLLQARQLRRNAGNAARTVRQRAAHRMESSACDPQGVVRHFHH